jgi:AcrR family transcriptional regulator
MLLRWPAGRQRSGTSPALVIYYFKTRDQLLTEAIRYSEDSWYAEGLRRMGEIPTAAGRLAELVAMTCLPGTDPEPRSWWLLWLDLWALSPRNPGVGAVRQKSDERWRETIRSIVLAGQEAGEFASVDADDFAITLSALLDGLAVQIALEDPQVSPQRTYQLAMRFAAGQLQFGGLGHRGRGCPPATGRPPRPVELTGSLHPRPSGRVNAAVK